MTGGQSRSRRTYPRGLSLVEIIAATTLFLVVMSAALGAFTFIIRLQSRELALQANLDNIRTTLEIMVRAIRQAEPNTLDATTCGTSCLQFTHSDPVKGNMQYRLLGASINENNATYAGNPGIPITTADVVIDKLNFNIIGGDPSDGQQPLVTINLQLHSVTQPNIVLSFQTSASLRNPQE
jgi:Tfp pilus assembly protein PilW